MALREFRDRKGVLWRVWAVTPEFMHPATAAEDYLGEYQDGWLTFECPESRRRMPRIPRGWESFPDHQLAQLLDGAEPSAPRRLPGASASGEQPLFAPRPSSGAATRPSGAPPQPPASPPPPPAPSSASREMTPTGRRRIFSDPTGHVVIAGVERPNEPASDGGRGHERAAASGVLRFRCDDKRVFDLPDWPPEWDRLPKPELIELYARARRETEREAAQRTAERASRPAESPSPPPRRRAADR